jgi:hypothetical protein
LHNSPGFVVRGWAVTAHHSRVTVTCWSN